MDALRERVRSAAGSLEEFLLEPSPGTPRAAVAARGASPAAPRRAAEPPLARARDVGRAAPAVGRRWPPRSASRRPARSTRLAAVLLADLDRTPGARGPTLLASAAARDLEDAVRDRGDLRSAAARGHLCHVSLEGRDGLDRLAALVAAPLPASLVIAHLAERDWPRALSHPGIPARGGLLQADLPGDRALVALAVGELHEHGLRARVAGRPLGRIAARRALTGIEPGGAVSRRARRFARSFLALRAERGQSLILVLGAVFALLFAALVLTAIVGAVTGKSRVQRAADLAAISGARSLRDDFDGLFAPPRLPNGAPNPAHLSKAEYLSRAEDAAVEAAARNGVAAERVEIRFPDAESFAPLRVRARIEAELASERPPRRSDRRRRDERIPVAAAAVAEASPPATGGAGAAGQPAMASGGGYSGPLAYRQGKPMRPDVAAAFDRMAAAARAAGISLTITSAFRSDAEQARALRPAPGPDLGRAARAVASPLRDRARPRAVDAPTAGSRPTRAASASSSATRWEPWHFGFVEGPAPCSDEGNSVGAEGESADGESGSGGGLPAFVPERYRRDDPALGGALERLRRACSRRSSWPSRTSTPTPSRPPAPRASPSSCPAPPPPTASTTPSTPPRRSTPRPT